MDNSGFAAAGGSSSSEAVCRVRTELERVREQERAVYAGAAKSLDDLIGALQQTVATIKADDASLKTIHSSVVGAAKSVSEHKNTLAKEVKQLFASVTAFGTELDRTVPQNLEKAVKADIFAPATVNQVIADALLRDGRFALAQQMADEARARSAGGSTALAVAGTGAGGAAFHAATAAWTGASVDALRVAFEELHSVVAALRARNVQPAIAWATQQRAVLQCRRSGAIGVGDVKYPLTSSSSPSASSLGGAVAMSDDAPSGAASVLAPGAAATSAEPSYGAVGSSTAERLDALHDLLFALHRLRFLQLLTVDSPCAVHNAPVPAVTSSGAPQLTLALARSLSASPAAASSSAAAAAVANGSGPTPMAVSKSEPAPAPAAAAGRATASPGRPAAAAAAATASVGPPASSLYAAARTSTAAAATAMGASASGTSSSASLPAKSVLSARISHYTLAALNYAQHHFVAFAKTHMSEIQRLSGCVLFGFDLTRAAQTYPELTTCALWDDAESAFRTAAYRSLGVSARSPLHAALTASDVSLPKLIRHAVVTEQAAALLVGARGGGAGGSGGAAVDVLSSAEVDLGREHQYHTTFICPVTKDQTTHDNPPVLLRCGHVISTNAMHKMIRSNRINRSGRFKCPTCPREQLPTEVLTVHF